MVSASASEVEEEWGKETEWAPNTSDVEIYYGNYNF